MNKQINKKGYNNFVISSSISWRLLLRCSVVLSVFMASLFVNAFAQTETFDIATYTAPKDFKKDSKQGVVNYININETKGSFCVIAMYASKASTGNAQKDFNNEWKEFVVTPYKAAPNPKIETQTTDGWKIVNGTAPVKLDGTDCYILLTLISGFGKTMSVRTSFNDESYTAVLNALFATMELDKTTTAVVSNKAQPPADNNVTTASNSSAGKFGLMIYNPPAGWSHQVFGDGVVFKPSDLPANEHLAIQIMQPLTASGTLEQAMAKSYEEATIMYNGTSMYQSDGKFSKNPIKKSFNGWEYIRGKGGIKVNDGTQFGTEYGLELFVIKVNNRFERIAILESRPKCKPSYLSYYTSDRISYHNAIENLLFSVQFTDFKSTVLSAGSINGGGLLGIWQGTIQSTGAATGIKLEVFAPVFFDNGQVYFGNKFPLQGLDAVNSRALAELNQRNWATYSYSNGRGVLKMPYGEIPFRKEGTKLIITKNQRDWPFYKLQSVDGARFNGTYTMSESYGKIPSISFTTDGKFTDKGALNVLCHEYVDCVNPAINPGSGTYEVKNYTVHFNYSDGRKIKIAFPCNGYDIRNPSPSVLQMSYNEDKLTKQ
ncbi:MAG: hypothetical protein SGI83_07625 [Bacteroidota bacterium]|nr:hypothetical protein [Bacteroidota bacterium]